MTEQSNAELIAELRGFAAGSESARATLMRDAAAALEAAEQRAADAEVQAALNYGAAGEALRAAAQRDQYAAVVEKVRVYAESIPRTRDRDVNPGLSKRSWLTAQDVLDILDDTPADALRERDAEKWDEGLKAGLREGNDKAHGVVNNPTPNPYRQAKRVLMTHPHDGHDLGDTCLDCQRREERA